MSKKTDVLLIIVTTLSLSMASGIQGGGIENLLEYTMPMGSMSNVNSPQIIEDQAGGFVTGGSIIVRGPAPQELQPFQIQLPSFKHDPCGGSGDFRFGAFSYINGEEFVRFMKGIPRAAGAYAAHLFLKTACPQCENIISQLQTRIERINGITMNQCSLAQDLVDGVGSKMLAGSKLACQIRSNATKRNQDLWATTAACQDNPDVYKGIANEEVKNLINEEFNLAWKALAQNNNTSSTKDQEFLELIMSITGTVIGERTDGTVKMKLIPSLFTNAKQIEDYMGGSEVKSIKVYVCDEPTKCLNPKIREKTLRQEDTFHGKLEKILASIRNKIITDGMVTGDEESVITYSSLPIINILEQELILKGEKGQASLMYAEMLDVVAVDVVVGFLHELLDQGVNEIKRLEFAQIDTSIFKTYRDSLGKVSNNLKDHKLSAFHRATITLQAKEYLKQQDIVLTERFNRMISSND